MPKRAAEATGSVEALGRVNYVWGNALFPLADYEGCLQRHGRALQLFREAGSPDGEALALGGLGDAYYLRGRMITAFSRFSECVDVCRRQGCGKVEAANRYMMGWTRSYSFEFDQALMDAREATQLAVALKQRRAELQSLMLCGYLNIKTGELHDALDAFEKALDLSRVISAGNFEANILGDLSEIHRLQGNTGRAEAYARKSVALMREVGHRFCGPYVLTILAATLSDPEAVRDSLDEAEKMLDAGSVSHNHFYFAFSGTETCHRTR